MRKKIVLIGGNSGIGLSLINKLNKDGNEIVATYNKSKPDDMEGLRFYKHDVTSNDSDFDFLPEIIDALVYLPGSINLKPFGRVKNEDFINDYKLQFLGAVNIIQASIKKLRKSKNASVVLFSTVAVQHGLKYHSIVSSSKAAVEGLTRSLAAEFAPKIRFNCIAPSLTDTPLAENLLKTEKQRETNDKLHPLQRIGKANDIANMAEFLISEKSEWISGQVLAVDGGKSSLLI